ncbi:MAG: hypothetical protein C0605_06700 [Hyphomicrobiales bacterium]|nr:MAG: hypothetical protein C0605_06700 [Hyphomicrobiales bacterium]
MGVFMTKHIKITTLVGAGLLGATMLATPALATQGYFPHAFGIQSKGVAGSDVAFAQSAMTIAMNPAGLSDVKDQLNVGISLFSPNRKYSSSHTVTPSQTSKKTLFAIPNFGYSRKLTDKATFGFAVYAAGGMNTTYQNDIFSPGAGKTGVDLMQVGLSPALSYKLTDMVSVGVAPIFSISRFKATGLQAFTGFSSSPSQVTNRGYDWAYGFGGRVGFQVKPSDMFSFGAYYQSRIYMTKFKKYAGLFAEQGDFDIPASAGVGVAFKPRPGLTLTGAYKRVWYSKVKSIGTPGSNLGAPCPAGLGSDCGAGFGWKDVNIASVGVTYDVNDRTTVRAGYSYNNNPISSSEVTFNILAPAVVKHHITGGLSYKLSDNMTLDLAGMFAPTGKVSGLHQFVGPGSFVTNKMWQAEASGGLTWNF